jgi:hypothetical protein
MESVKDLRKTHANNPDSLLSSTMMNNFFTAAHQVLCFSTSSKIPKIVER